MHIYFKRSSPSSSAEAPSERLGSSHPGSTRQCDFYFIEFRPADIPNCRSVSCERLLRAPQQLRLRLCRSKEKRCRSAVSYSATLHNCQLTNPFNSLQAGKTLDILRFATEIKRLAFRLPHCLGRIHGLRLPGASDNALLSLVAVQMVTIRCAAVIDVCCASANHLARFIRLLYVGKAATEEPKAAEAANKRKSVCSRQPVIPLHSTTVSPLHPVMPPPPREDIDRGPPSKHPKC